MEEQHEEAAVEEGRAVAGRAGRALGTGHGSACSQGVCKGEIPSFWGSAYTSRAWIYTTNTKSPLGDYKNLPVVKMNILI